MDRAHAVRLLQLQLPTTAAAVKTAFKRRALQVHPDQNKAAGTKEAFISLQRPFPDKPVFTGDPVIVLVPRLRAKERPVEPSTFFNLNGCRRHPTIPVLEVAR